MEMNNFFDFNISIEVWFIAIWFIVIIFGAIIEALTMDLTSIWFSLAALGSLVLGIFGVNIVVQFIVFLVISIALLLSVRPLAQNYFKTNIVSTNSDRLIGKTAKCTKGMLAGSRGEVKVNGQTWTSISQNDADIDAGDSVEILAIEGVKLIVKKR